MSLYVFRTVKCDKVSDWVKETKLRGKSDNLLKNPFKWRLKTLTRDKYLFVVVDVKPLFPNVSVMGWVGGLGVLVIWGATPWLIPFFFIGALGVFWTSEFYYWMTKRALKKKGYKASVKRVKPVAFIREVIL